MAGNIWDNTLELVHRDVWLANEAIPRGQLLDASSANSVIVSQTGGPECIDSGRCARLVREMQARGTYKLHSKLLTNFYDSQIVANISTGVDIAFNFLIAGNGQTFEARGWSHRQSAINKSVVPSTTMSGHLLTIAFVGDFSRRPPSELMLRQADALLAIAVQSGRLESDYRAYGAIDGTEIGWVLFDVLAKRWRTRWETVIDK